MNCVPVRTRGLNNGAIWERRFREAEAVALRAAYEPDQEKKEQIWKECINLIKEAQLLLLADPNYLRREGMDITLEVLAYCRDQIYGEQRKRSSSSVDTVSLDIRPDLIFLGISSEEDIEARLNSYGAQVLATRSVIREKEII